MPNYKLWFDEENQILHFKAFRTLTREDMEQMLLQIRAKSKDRERRLILANVSENEEATPDKQARRVLKHYSTTASSQKVATLGANPSIRMVAVDALKMVGR